VPRKKRYPHIYFESKKRGRDSVLAAVPDIGRPGVRSSKEVKLLAFAQLADYADGKTVDHSGRVRRFTSRLWSGRMLVLRRLAKRYGGVRAVKIATEYRRFLDEARSWREKRSILLEAAHEMGLPKKMAERIIRKVKQ